MKKLLRKFTFILITVSVAVSNVWASTNTTKRTEDNLQVSKSIRVTSKNKNLILKTPKVDESEKIYDFADLLTSKEEESLYEAITSFINQYAMDMVVVTINENNKSNAQNYADDFYDYNYFGKGSTFDGILFLMDMDTREMWISTTGDAIIFYDDARIESILDKTYVKIKAKDYYGCANAFVVSAGSYAKAGVPSSNSNAYIDKEGEYVVKSVKGEVETDFFIIFIFSFIVSLAFVLIAAVKHRMIKIAVNAKNYLKNVEISKRQDLFLTTNTTSIYISSSSSSGGGSSFHHSSSGRSHGGGGRSF